MAHRRIEQSSIVILWLAVLLTAACGGSRGSTAPSQPLVVPLDRLMLTNDFRAIGDTVLSYREAGSFMRFVVDRYGVPRTLEFFRISRPTDDITTIKARFQAAFGVSIEAVEGAWLTRLRNPNSVQN